MRKVKSVSEAVFDEQAVVQTVQQGLQALLEAQSTDERHALRTQYAGAQSEVTRASKMIGSLPNDQKKTVGKIVGQLRADFGRAYALREQELIHIEE